MIFLPNRIAKIWFVPLRPSPSWSWEQISWPAVPPSIRNASGMWKGLGSRFQAYFLDIYEPFWLHVSLSGFGGLGGTPDALMPPLALVWPYRSARAQSRGTPAREKKHKGNSKQALGKRAGKREREKKIPVGREKQLLQRKVLVPGPA